MDGAQARLKQNDAPFGGVQLISGKGGWGSGEIETWLWEIQPLMKMLRGKGGWGSGEIETDNLTIFDGPNSGGKGGWGSGEIETCTCLWCT